MAASLKIIKAQVIVSSGPDNIILYTDLPEATFPFKNKAVLKMHAASETGAEYVREHFKLEPEIIKV